MALMTRAPGESNESWERRCSILLMAIKRVSALPQPHCWLIPPPLPVLHAPLKVSNTFTWEPVT